MSEQKNEIAAIYPKSCSLLSPEAWDHLFPQNSCDIDPESLSSLLAEAAETFELPAYLSELARLEYLLWETRSKKGAFQSSNSDPAINPTLVLTESLWEGIPALLSEGAIDQSKAPVPGKELVMIWLDPESGRAAIQAAGNDDLLALKIVAENLDIVDVAEEGDVPVEFVRRVIRNATHKGILLAPATRIRRDPSIYLAAKPGLDEYTASTEFTLQWHLTQRCDLHCKHCYDRSSRQEPTWKQAMHVLDELQAFCRTRKVQGHITFTGGNPLLFPHFFELYQESVKRGFSVAVLGNPGPREAIEKLNMIEPPDFFQVSLEGLEEHNDSIRGKGHFKRTMDFLHILKDLGIYSMVMLTLTRDNMAHVLPLAQILRGRADTFNFNRLSMVGEGAKLRLPKPQHYEKFLCAYVEAADRNPVMGLKDNLINIVLERQGQELFGGCTGFGCGAAFNFLALLPDGEVHACRKFPSKLGNIFDEPLEEIYDSEGAKRYRLGPEACKGCHIRPVCGGCMASAFSFGLDIFKEKDPFCPY